MAYLKPLFVLPLLDICLNFEIKKNVLFNLVYLLTSL